MYDVVVLILVGLEFGSLLRDQRLFWSWGVSGDHLGGGVQIHGPVLHKTFFGRDFYLHYLREYTKLPVVPQILIRTLLGSCDGLRAMAENSHLCSSDRNTHSEVSFASQQST